MDQTTIDLDVSCAVCSYNLRGLELNGRCPECGTFAGQTLLERVRSADAQLGASRPDDRVLRQAIQGAVLLAMAFVLMIAAALVSQVWFSNNHWQITALFTAECIVWVLACCGFWKFGAAPATPPASMYQSERSVRTVLRISAVMLLIWPAGYVLQHDTLRFWLPGWGEFLVSNALIITLLTIAPAFMFRVRQLARGLASPKLGGLATVLACVSSAALVYWRRYGDDINWMLIIDRIPIPLLGSFQNWRRSIERAIEGDWTLTQIRTESWIAFVVWLLSVWVVAILWIRARRALRTMRASAVSTPRTLVPRR